MTWLFWAGMAAYWVLLVYLLCASRKPKPKPPEPLRMSYSEWYVRHTWGCDA